ncbi:hypothetical protein VN97_g6733 [Penicillium thymicola]|uniref:Beta-lactamase-related domain-containing protein n=1 Tax=Penicillium thymicola TaxID=293382 RepID=A0AAI9TFU3_PENTH|nr:hypothetical protein VN97_g6733 [Penicillium thymicola]
MKIFQVPILVFTLAGVFALENLADPTRIPLPSWSGCPINGPLLPRPTHLDRSQTILDAAKNLTEALDSAMQKKSKAGFDVDNTSFSIAFITPRQKNASDKSNGILWSYHHLGRKNFRGTEHLNEGSQYLIGSISKVFSDLLLLKSDIHLDDPITKYVPGLQKERSPIQWSNITLSALSNHLAGIPSNLPSSFEYYFLRSVYQQLGFPSIANESYPDCGVGGLSKACNKTQIIEMMSSALPVREPYTEPVYSSLSFELFALALSQKTGKSYIQMLNETILGPLGLKNTGASPGNDERAVIPPLDEDSLGWGSDYGYAAPGGGLYSSLGDLAILTTRILDETIFSDPQTTRKWLKPQSMTSGINGLVGRPWEIQRTKDLIPENPHTVDIYAKGGGANGYVSQMSLVDEYGVGFVVLTAGPREAATASILNEAVITSFIPAVDSETRSQALAYAGNFSVGSIQNPKKIGSKDITPVGLSLSINEGTGLKIDSLTRNGSDILAGLGKLWNSLLPMTGILNPDFRIYPTGIETPVEGEDNMVFEDWRINFDAIPADNAAMSDLPGQGKLSNVCASWQMESWIYYGGEALDRIVFKVDREAGNVIGVNIPFLRTGLLPKA